jgi:hypothetical protein
MPSLDLAGIGIWGEPFADWEQFCAVVRGEAVDAATRPQAELIAARDRRRAPQFVKMAVEVMDQACRMADIDRSTVATVFGSSLGDVQVTDYMCRTVATDPRSLSPTRFHNSVHNACTGYWSIATGSNTPANAVSAHDHSPAIALLEGAVQAIEESIPVVVAFQEIAAPPTFEPIFPARQPLAVALLLMPENVCERPLGTLSLTLDHDRPANASAATPLIAGLAGNFAASILDLLRAVAAGGDYVDRIAASDWTALAVNYSPFRTLRRAQAE